MTQENSATSSQLEPPSQANASPIEDMPEALYSETINGVPFFPVTGKITFKPMTAAPKAGAWDLSPSVARLVSAVSLSAVLLLPLSACGSCPSSTSATNGTPTATCTSSSGSHGGFHPTHNPGHGGVGGDGHGGSEGG